MYYLTMVITYRTLIGHQIFMYGFSTPSNDDSTKSLSEFNLYQRNLYYKTRSVAINDKYNIVKFIQIIITNKLMMELQNS